MRSVLSSGSSSCALPIFPVSKPPLSSALPLKPSLPLLNLSTGVSSLELSKLLTAAFKLGGQPPSLSHAAAPPPSPTPAVVGFEDEATGVIFPISLACSGGLPAGAGVCYRLLLTDSEGFLCPSPTSPGAANVCDVTNEAEQRSTAARTNRPKVKYMRILRVFIIFWLAAFSFVHCSFLSPFLVLVLIAAPLFVDPSQNHCRRRVKELVPEKSRGP